MSNTNFETWIINVMSGRSRGPIAAALRAGLSMIEPLYSSAAKLRNESFELGLRRVVDVGRPVISVGNVTTGGTGKTPIVIWIANHLREIGQRPAILMRGYKSSSGLSDEAVLLERFAAPSPVVVGADRAAAAIELLRRDSAVGCFILDDAFQHRRIARQLDLVLIDATAPFGFGHVLPRGLLRESLSGLRRCDAIILTRCDRVTEAEIQKIILHVRANASHKPVLRCSMAIDHFLDSSDQPHPVAEAGGSFAICGIGNPSNFLSQMTDLAGPLLGSEVFADHHAYSEADLTRVRDHASAVKAKQILTTEKDWTKLASLYARSGSAMPFWRANQKVEWASGDDENLTLMLRATMADG